MKKVLSIAVAAAFAASSFAVVAQDKKAEKKQEVKSAQGSNVKSAGGAPVTTATNKPKDTKGVALPAPDGKRKTEAERMAKDKK